MSHNKLRTEKNCLNCGHTVEERYCPQCGQENIELHDAALHLFIHFVQDVFHYDGKFWHTLRGLIRKPGFVAAEYIDGKRMHNFHPIRFYFFTSTVFFLLLFYMVKLDDGNGNHNPAMELNRRMYFLKKEKEHRIGNADTVEINRLIETLQHSLDSANGIVDTLVPGIHFGPAKVIGDSLAPVIELGPASVEADDTFKLEEMGWLGKMLKKRNSELEKEYEAKNPGDTNASTRAILAELFHKLPQLIFLSLPFFAFFLKILYFRAKRRLYVEHLIFSIYQYSYLYFMLAVLMLINWVTGKIGNDNIDSFVDYIRIFIILYLFVYLMLAMKRFYIGRWRYLLPKYFILMFLMMFTILGLGTVVGLVTYLL